VTPQEIQQVAIVGFGMRDASRTILLAGIFAFALTGSFACADVFESAGLPLTKPDLQKMSVAAQPLLNDDSLPVGTKRSWFNIRSGNHGFVTLLRRFEYEHHGRGLSCRTLVFQVKLLPPSDPYNLALNRCKTAEGIWKTL
jgi:hypothetical protein